MNRPIIFEVHFILLCKLEHYGICGIALKLLKSFLTDRSQFVADENLRTNYYSLSISTTFLTHCSLNPGYLPMTHAW